MNDRLVERLWHWYGHTYDGLRSFWPYTHLISLVVDALAPVTGETIAELGCGTGNVLELISRRAQTKLYGVDRSSTMLGVARTKLDSEIAQGELELQQADILDWLRDRPDNSLDAVVSVNVFYAIADQEGLWRELSRVVRPGGRVVVTTSVKTGSWPIIREQFDHDHWWRLLRPKLLGVFILDALINLLGRTGTFAFADEATLRHAAEGAGGQWEGITRCYGGADRGVNILFRVTIPA